MPLGDFMAENKLKTKDMIIAVICTLLAVLSIVFYFLPAFSVEHSVNLNFDNSEKLFYSAWDMTKAVFTNTKDFESSIIGLLYIKDVYGMAVMLAGILMPLGIAFTIATTVFAYLSWFMGERWKKYCFLCSLCAMIFTTITLIATWYIAIQLRSNGTGELDYFAYNIKGSIAYGSFVSLIIAFVVAIVACAYNYFLDNFDEEEYDDEDEEEEVEETKSEPKSTIKASANSETKSADTKVKTTAVKSADTKPTSKSK